MRTAFYDHASSSLRRRQDKGVRFQRVLDDTIAKVRKVAIDQRTALRRAAYHHGPNRVFARMYGYRLTRDGRAEVVPEEAAVVREVIRGFSEALPVETIKARLDARGVRNRSRKPFSRGELIGLARRSLFGGKIKGPAGVKIRSGVYPPIVSFKEWPKAAQNASKEHKNEEFEALSDTHDDDDWLLAVE